MKKFCEYNLDIKTCEDKFRDSGTDINDQYYFGILSNEISTDFGVMLESLGL